MARKSLKVDRRIEEICENGCTIIFEDDGSKHNRAVGIRRNGLEYRVGDALQISGADGKTWLALAVKINEDTEDPSIDTLWFYSHSDIKPKSWRRNFPEDEYYITLEGDLVSFDCIIGKAQIVSQYELANGKDQFTCRMAIKPHARLCSKEFKWNEVYSGARDIEKLRKFIEKSAVNREVMFCDEKKQAIVNTVLPTEVLPKIPKTPSRRKRKHSDDEYTEGITRDEEILHGKKIDGGAGSPVKTPRLKRTRIGLFNIDSPSITFPTTPRSGRRFILDRSPRRTIPGSHRSRKVKPSLDVTPLGVRTTFFEYDDENLTPFQLARSRLHAAAATTTTGLTGREKEWNEIIGVLMEAINNDKGRCIYISGIPGTGKTATVRGIIKRLQHMREEKENKLKEFSFVEINGLKVTEAKQAYSMLWETLYGERLSPREAFNCLESEFEKVNTRNIACVVLMDEIDQLLSQDEQVILNFLRWPSIPSSRLIVIAVSNTMDLPERVATSRSLNLHRITFAGYTFDQLVRIIEERLCDLCGKVDNEDSIVRADAIQFAARKVAAVSGDARRALDICRRAVEIAEIEYLRVHGDDDESRDYVEKNATSTISRNGIGKYRVTIATIRQAVNEANHASNSIQEFVKRAPLTCKILLMAIVDCVRFEQQRQNHQGVSSHGRGGADHGQGSQATLDIMRVISQARRLAQNLMVTGCRSVSAPEVQWKMELPYALQPGGWYARCQDTLKATHDKEVVRPLGALNALTRRSAAKTLALPVLPGLHSALRLLRDAGIIIHTPASLLVHAYATQATTPLDHTVSTNVPSSTSFQGNFPAAHVAYLRLAACDSDIRAALRSDELYDVRAWAINSRPLNMVY